MMISFWLANIAIAFATTAFVTCASPKDWEYEIVSNRSTIVIYDNSANYTWSEANKFCENEFFTTLATISSHSENIDVINAALVKIRIVN